MTDLETIKAMFDGAGIVYTMEPEEKTLDPVVSAHDGEFNKGYPGFMSLFEFTHEGKLLTLGAWE